MIGFNSKTREKQYPVTIEIMLNDVDVIAILKHEVIDILDQHEENHRAHTKELFDLEEKIKRGEVKQPKASRRKLYDLEDKRYGALRRRIDKVFNNNLR